MKKISNIIILAGGDGDRFWPLKDKLLTSFLGKPLILHMIEGLEVSAGKIWVVCSRQNIGIMAKTVGSKAVCVEQSENKAGMAGAVLSCKGLVHGEALVLGNDLFDFSAIASISDKRSSGKDLVFLAKKVGSYFPGGYLELKDGRVTGIVEKPAPDKTPSDLVNLVVDYFADLDDFISKLEGVHVETDDHYERAMDIYMKEGRADHIVYEAYWTALKYSWDILSMMNIFLKKLDKSRIDHSSEISAHALIAGPVCIGKNVRIGDFAKIVGPCYIGDNAVVADYALVRESHIGQDCLIGSSSEVVRSYLDQGVSLHRNYVGDSVLGRGVLFGAGAVTANFRFDEGAVFSSVNGKKVDSGRRKMGTVVGSGSKIGVNATVFPGIKVGANSLIGPGEAVFMDVADGSFMSRGAVKQKKQI